MQINVLEYLEHSAELFADRCAVSDSTNRYSYRELHARAQGLGWEISQRTNKKCQPIAIFLPKGADCIVSFLAVLYSGNIYTPIDLKAPLERLRTLLSNLQPTLFITSAEGTAILEALGIGATQIIRIEEAATHVSDAQRVQLAQRWQSLIDTDPAYILHTSGSTGVPKGVVISHRSIIDYIAWAQSVFHVDCNNIIGNQAPFYFDNSTLDIYIALESGSELHIIPEKEFIFPQQLMTYVLERSVTFLFWVPSIMVNVANMRALENKQFPALKYVLFAGEVMPTRCMNTWKRHIPHAVFANLYGPTEITVDCTFYVVDREFEDTEPLPIGKACRNSGLLILNAQDTACAKGEIGELCVKGTSLALGYWNQLDKTREVFVQNPLNPYFPEIIYRTGDLVYLNERDEIMYVGRKDSQIKHMGVRIELGEIEQAVTSIAGVEEACVLYDDQAKQIVLFYAAAEDISVPALRKAFAPKLPKVMWPTIFNRMERLPLNSSGKIDRKHLDGLLKNPK